MCSSEKGEVVEQFKEKKRHLDAQYITLFKKRKENVMYLHSQLKTTCLEEFEIR